MSDCVYVVLAEWADHSGEAEAIAAFDSQSDADRALKWISAASPMKRVRVVEVPLAFQS